MNKKDLFHILYCFSELFCFLFFLMYLILGIADSPEILDLLVELGVYSDDTAFCVLFISSIFLFFLFAVLSSVFARHYYSKKD